MAFRYSGTAWDGQKWRVAHSVKTLGDQIMVLRGTTQSFSPDWTVASKNHDAANPDSDHTVKPKIGSGIVYAIDFAERIISVDSILDNIRLSHDSRVLYGIHDSRMFSSYPTSKYPAWVWRPYGGTNGHEGHGHMSVVNDLTVADLTFPWHISPSDGPLPVGEQVLPLNPNSAREDIRQLQDLCNEAYQSGLTVDGVWGTSTASVVKSRLLKFTGTQDPDALAGNSVNANMWNGLHKEWTLAFIPAATTIDSTARNAAKRANDRLDGIDIPA